MVTNPILNQTYLCDGVTASFPVTIDHTGDELTVILFTSTSRLNLEKNVDWKYDPALNGNVVTTVYYPAGDRLYIESATPTTQENDFIDNDPLPAEVLEGSFDKVTILVKQAENLSDGAISYPEPDTGKVVLPFASDRANKFMQFDSLGDVQVVSQVDVGAVTFTPYGELLVDTADADAAKTLLELPPAQTADKLITVDGTIYDLIDLATELSLTTRDLGGYTLQVNVDPGNIDQPIIFSGFKNGLIILNLVGSAGATNHTFINAAYIRFENCDFVRLTGLGALLCNSVVPVYGTGVQTQQIGYVSYIGCGTVEHQGDELLIGNDVNAGTLATAGAYATACQSVDFEVGLCEKIAADPAFPVELYVESCSTLTGSWVSSIDQTLRADVGLKASAVILAMATAPLGKVSDTEYGDGVVTSETVEANAALLATLLIGTNRVGLTHWDTGTIIPAVEAGSSLEVGGTLYTFDTETVIADAPSDGVIYLGFTVSGDTLVPEFTNTKPTWDTVKGGFYIGDVRYSGHTMTKAGTAYSSKGWTLSHDRTFTVVTGPSGVTVADPAVVGTIIGLRDDAWVQSTSEVAVKLKEFTIPHFGTYRLQADTGADWYVAYFTVYVNGDLVGNYTHSAGDWTTTAWPVTVKAGDVVSIWARSAEDIYEPFPPGIAHIRNTRLMYGNIWTDDTKVLLGFEV